MQLVRREPGRALLPVAAYLLLLLVRFYPQSLRPWDSVGAIPDSAEAVWVVSWNAHQFFKNPLKILDANVVHPNPRSLTLTDHRLLPSLVGAPVIWATGNPVLAYNFVLTAGCLLAALTARRLARRLGCPPLPAWVAGALYAFSAIMVDEGLRLHMVAYGLVPLALERLVAFLKTGKRRYALHWAATAIALEASSSCRALDGALLLALVTLAVLAGSPRLVARRVLTLMVIAFVALLVAAPLLTPYLTLRGARSEFVRRYDAGGSRPPNPRTRTWLTSDSMYGARQCGRTRETPGVDFVQVGLSPLALVAVALFAWARRRGPVADAALLPTHVWVPAAALFASLLGILAFHDWLPGLGADWVAGRLGPPLMLFVALLSARALTVLNASRIPWLVPLLVVWIPLEQLSPQPVSRRLPVGRDVPAVYRWLGAHEVQALAEVPIQGDPLIRDESLEMYFSSFHFKPIIHGYGSFPPILTTVLRMLADEFPSEAALQAFERVGVDTIVFHEGLLGSERIRQAILERVAGGRLQPVARFAGSEAHVYRGTADEVFRLPPAAPGPVASFPSGRRKLEPSWTYRATAGEPALAADGDPSTAWTVPGPLKGGELYEVLFDKAIAVEGLVVRLRGDSGFPNAFRVAGRDGAGQWLTLARFDGPHKLELLERLLAEPRNAGVGFDLRGRELTGLMIVTEPEGRSQLGWSIPEIEVFTPCNCFRKAHISSTGSRVSRQRGSSSSRSQRTKARRA